MQVIRICLTNIAVLLIDPSAVIRQANSLLSPRKYLLVYPEQLRYHDLDVQDCSLLTNLLHLLRHLCLEF